MKSWSYRRLSPPSIKLREINNMKSSWSTMLRLTRLPWSRVFTKAFCAFYFALNLGAGAFLFTTRKNFDAAGGLDEKLFIAEEIYFSIALRRLGRFRILREPVVTSGRKLRMYSAREILGNSLSVILRGPRAARSREGLHIWYDGKRERRSAFTALPRDKST